MENCSPILSVRTPIRVPFYDVDSIQVVWHGNYLKYLENGREDFGEKFNLGYMTIFNNGYTAPIVDLQLQYKSPSKIGEKLFVITTFNPQPGAKIVFDYRIIKADESLVLTAQSTQIFINRQTNIHEPTLPPFYREWRKHYRI